MVSSAPYRQVGRRFQKTAEEGGSCVIGQKKWAFARVRIDDRKFCGGDALRRDRGCKGRRGLGVVVVATEF
ncbi:MAG: hypothetical protein DI579_04150 [Lawsonella clevelandensis]|uniref:Uncharacterized protein n=1 Tax=Lawsonella clevelandensis TaxID=1528099 RepID=A0A2W5K9D6_9ACTN|nr:MAG: hypothetical protein DI579_04150 [Lawsonella clevelandensis]